MSNNVSETTRIVACPWCKGKLRVPDRPALRAFCSHCNKNFIQEGDRTLVETVPGLSEKGQYQEHNCSHCKVLLRAPTDASSSDYTCPVCKETTGDPERLNAPLASAQAIEPARSTLRNNSASASSPSTATPKVNLPGEGSILDHSWIKCVFMFAVGGLIFAMSSVLSFHVDGLDYIWILGLFIFLMFTVAVDMNVFTAIAVALGITAVTSEREPMRDLFEITNAVFSEHSSNEKVADGGDPVSTKGVANAASFAQEKASSGGSGKTIKRHYTSLAYNPSDNIERIVQSTHNKPGQKAEIVKKVNFHHLNESWPVCEHWVKRIAIVALDFTEQSSLDRFESSNHPKGESINQAIEKAYLAQNKGPQPVFLNLTDLRTEAAARFCESIADGGSK